MGTQPSDSASINLASVLARQQDPDDHDRGLILERLSWTAEERLDANTAFLRFYLTVRPDGPLVSDEPA